MPSRRSIVDRLARGPASVSELAKPLDVSLAAVVQHVHVLEECGIVRTEKVGRVRICRIEPAALAVAESWITERRAMLEEQLDRLDAFLTKQPSDGDISTDKEERP